MRKALIIILILFIFIVGCKRAIEPAADETAKAVESPPEVPDIGSELNQVDTLDEELSLGELENLDLEINEDIFN